MLQSVIENTKIILPVCDKPNHKNKENLPQLEELDTVLNYVLHFML